MLVVEGRVEEKELCSSVSAIREQLHDGDLLMRFANMTLPATVVCLDIYDGRGKCCPDLSIALT